MRTRIALVCALSLSASGASATILTFGDLSLSNFDPIPQEYGDNVVSTNDGVGSYLEGNGFTPNVTTSYRTLDGSGNSTVFENHIEYWDAQYGDLRDVGYASADFKFAEVTFTAAPGFEVLLNSFDLGGWPLTDKPGQQLRIYDGSYNLLQDFTPIFVEGTNGHTAVDVGLASSVIRIQWGSDWDVGIDNINFDQRAAVPEPSTVVLLALGLAGAVLASRRRRS